MKKGRLLIVDDNVQILNSLKILLDSEFEQVDGIRNPNLIPSKIQASAYNVIMLDMNYASGDTSGNEGLFWLREILKHDPLVVVIFITAYGDIELAVRGIKEGATDFITKPWNPEKLITTLKNACELHCSRVEVVTLKSRQEQMHEDIDRGFRMVTGPSPAFARVLEIIEKVAATDVDILITGENGTGKELVAREIHRRSNRVKEIFVAADVGSLSESLFESEMFGHVRGAFTDAREDKQGRFEWAAGGTLFLDEIGNLSLNLQAKLLQVIQNRIVFRVGSSKPIPVNVRLITATNKPLPQMVSAGTFRQDLYFRLNTMNIELPPLRNRVEDIPVLSNYFLQEYARKYEKPYLKIHPKAMEKLCIYAWPGNIRELRHTIEKLVILCEGKAIMSKDLYLQNGTLLSQESSQPSTLNEIEKNVILNTLSHCSGNYSLASKILDISRTTLYAKIKKYGL